MLAGERLNRKRPFDIQRDGDFWGAVDHVSKQRGAESVRIQWTPGHATLKMAEQGVVEVTAVVGNDHVDWIAKSSRAQSVGRFDPTDAVGHYFAAKHGLYVSFLYRLYCMFLRVLAAEGEAREAHGRALAAADLANGVDSEQVVIPPRCPFVGTIGFLLQLTPLVSVATHAVKSTPLGDVHAFLSLMTWAPPCCEPKWHVMD